MKTRVRTSRSRWAGAFCLAGLLAGCAVMHDDDRPRAHPIAPEQVRLASDIQLAREGWPDARWWTRYGDPQLNALIDRALAHSPTMAVARSRIEHSRAQVQLTSAFSKLQVLGFGLFTQDIAGGGALVNLKFDPWGLQRATVEASMGARNAQLAEAAAVELDLSTAVARLYYSMQGTYQLIDLLEQSRAILADETQAHQARFATGLDARGSVHMPRAKLLGVEREIVAARGQLQQAREALRALVAAGADDLPEVHAVPLPEAQAGLPTTLSYELLARRPDLQAMRWMAQSSLRKVDAARAMFYPVVDLAALFTMNTLQLGDLKLSRNQAALVPGVTLPLFDSARLNAGLDAAKATSDLIVEQYNQAVLDAVRDVAVAGSRLQALDAERELQQEKVRAMAFTQEAARASLQRGLASRLAAAHAGLPLIAERTALLMLDAQRLEQEIALTRALGGGYQSEPPKLDASG
jgi:multidrug efflux system outer membrane protein